MLVLLSGAYAGTWKGSESSRSWCALENWDGGVVPTRADLVIINPPSTAGPVIDGDAGCGELQGPVWKSNTDQVMEIRSGRVDIAGQWRFANRGKGVATVNISGGTTNIDGLWRWSDNGGTYGIVNMTGGIVRCKGLLIGDAGGGEINLSGNSHIKIDGDLDLGGNRGDAPLKIHMNGGLIKIGGAFKCPGNPERAGKVHVRLESGQIHCKSFFRAGGVPYTLELGNGELVIHGDLRPEIQNDIERGFIVALVGNGEPLCEYDKKKDVTVVMASGRTEARLLSPENHAQDVNPREREDETYGLHWAAPTGGRSYRVFHSERLEDVLPGAKALGAEEPIQLAYGRTYYWRVETLLADGRKSNGAIWQYHTSDGIASEPQPNDEAAGVAPNVTLRWKPAVGAESYAVYVDEDPEKVSSSKAEHSGVAQGESFPVDLMAGKTYNWKVNAIEGDQVRPGDVWSFTIDDGQPSNPSPIDRAQWVAADDLTLSWKPIEGSGSYAVHFGKSLRAIDAGMSRVVAAQPDAHFRVSGLATATNYYWRIDVTTKGGVIQGDVWTFSTEGILDIKVDLALPRWHDRSQPRSLPRNQTAKSDWAIWSSPRWADMYMHDAVWFPEDGGKSIFDSGVRVYLSTGGGGTGAVHAKGLSRGGLAGDLPPYGEAEGDSIANTYFYACDWAGPKIGDVLLVLTGLPAGEYDLTSYHNFWEPTAQQTRNRRDAPSIMPPMPSITVHPLPPGPLPGYKNWSVPKGDGKGVTAIQNAANIPVTSALSDEEVSKSLVTFSTNGSGVLVIYEAPGLEYKDRARSGREGGRGVLNAFEIQRNR